MQNARCDVVEKVHVAVINGPGVRVHTEGLFHMISAWSRSITAEVQFLTCMKEKDILGLLDRNRRNILGGMVVNPGEGLSDEIHRLLKESGVPLAWVSTERPDSGDGAVPMSQQERFIRGRGIAGYMWALRSVCQRRRSPPITRSYGPERDQVGDLRLPATGDQPFPVVIVLHGGSWREPWERDTAESVAIDLARKGYASWNVEYRRVGPFGGGWPTTCYDVADAIDYVTVLASDWALDLDRVVLAGHSSGGQLACWAVTRRGDDRGRAPQVLPRLVVSLAGDLDLLEEDARGVGSDSVREFLGGAASDCPETYREASPMSLLPLRVRQIVAVGNADAHFDLIDDAHRYVDAACDLGDEVELVIAKGADHFSLIEPNSMAWHTIVQHIDTAMR